jgi:hypothetical protein
MLAATETRMRLDELKKLLEERDVNHDLKVIGSVLLHVCERLEQLSAHVRDQDDLLRPEEHRCI